MKRYLFTAALAVVLVAGLQATAVSGGPGNGKGGPKADCATIAGGDLVYRSGHYLAGETIPTGFDPYGYNYNGHMFRGSYYNVYSGGAGFPPWNGDDAAYLADNPAAAGHWAWPWRHFDLSMKWNEAWLSNADCDGDGALDRHYGMPSYVGSGAWLTNHLSWTDEDGRHNAYTAIVAAPGDALWAGGDWWTADGTLIGPSIWGSFAITLDLTTGYGPAAPMVSPNGPGFGQY